LVEGELAGHRADDARRPLRPPPRGDLVSDAVGIDAELVQLTASDHARLLVDQRVEGLLHDGVSSP
jgi:hypothetical protein